MKYGYMDDMRLAQMDVLDKTYESERMEEIRAINNLTAMSEKTTDKLAYEEAKKYGIECEDLKDYTYTPPPPKPAPPPLPTLVLPFDLIAPTQKLDMDNLCMWDFSHKASLCG